MSSAPALALVAGGVSDLDTLGRISVAAFDPRYGEAWSTAQLRGTLGQPGSWLSLAVQGDTPLGFALCRPLVDEAELLLIAVVPVARGTGVGGALLNAAIAEARDRGLTEIFLEMRDGNAAARALYTGRGFVEVGRRRDYYRGSGNERFDSLTMRRPLNP